MDRLRQAIAHAERNENTFCVLFVDLDNFKSINDRFGHDVGDSVLRSAARSIFQYLRAHDALIRWGGEEFVVLLPKTDLMAALEVVQQIGKEGIGRTPDGSRVTASIGIAEYLVDRAPDPTTLIQLSDRRMYAAKAAGRNCCVSGLGDPIRFAGTASGTAEPAARHHRESIEPRRRVTPVIEDSLTL